MSNDLRVACITLAETYHFSKEVSQRVELYVSCATTEAESWSHLPLPVL